MGVKHLNKQHVRHAHAFADTYSHSSANGNTFAIKPRLTHTTTANPNAHSAEPNSHPTCANAEPNSNTTNANANHAAQFHTHSNHHPDTARADDQPVDSDAGSAWR